MKTLIKNGMLIDGTGAPGTPGDLLMEGERIVAVGRLESPHADVVVDAAGLAVAPGFIDTHSHSDLEVFKEPELAPKLRQGITTEILGQDGISMAPLPQQFISPWRKNLAGLDGDKDDLDWTYGTTENYLNLLEKNGSGTNLCYLVPHGNVRMEARGLGSGVADAAELRRMCEILARELEAGGFGFSTGLIYMPCAYADTREMVETCKVAAKFDVPFVIHQRSEADTIVDSMHEVINIGRDSGVKVHFSHFKLCGKN
ncbi:N-acyl-D-amino-acid deacylase family protein, partial [Desulfovibrio legallii]